MRTIIAMDIKGGAFGVWWRCVAYWACESHVSPVRKDWTTHSVYLDSNSMVIHTSRVCVCIGGRLSFDVR